MVTPLVFMGTPSYALPVLQALLKAGHPVRGVYTQPDRPAGRGRPVEVSPVKAFALERGLPVYQPRTLRSPTTLEELAILQPEVIVVAAYARLLPPEVLRLPRHGCLNVHPSLLPKYRGPSPVVTALLEGEATAGVTVMLMDEGLDTGPILAQREAPIEERDTGETLTQRLFEMGAQLLVETLPRWVAGEMKATPQDPARATVTRRITKEDGRLDWGQPAVRLWHQVRALDPWPGAYTSWRGRLLKILEASVSDVVAQGPPGMAFVILSRQGLRLAMMAGDGSALEVRRLQLEGRRSLTAAEFLRGQPALVGARLPS